MSVKAKVISAARWAADEAQERVTGGFRRGTHGGNPAFTRTWLREVISTMVSDKALDRAVADLVADGALELTDGGYCLSGASARPAPMTTEVNIGIKFSNLSSHSGFPVHARELQDDEVPGYLRNQLILDGVTYVQRRGQRKLDSSDASYPHLIRTGLYAKTHAEGRAIAREFAGGLLIVGKQIWYAEPSITTKEQS